MNLFFICRASTDIGLGHLIRSRTIAEVAGKRHQVRLLVLGSEVAKRLLAGSSFPYTVSLDDHAIQQAVNENQDVIVCDMMHLDDIWLEYLRQKATLLVSLSPVFNQMHRMDLLFSRTKYRHGRSDLTHVKQYTGLDYMIIPRSCITIARRTFTASLSRENLPVAICMGGGDAANKTHLFLNALRECQVPTTFWVLIGEGYTHSIDQLVNAIDRDKNHEIILAKTNVSMWHILNNCALSILSGGVTTYEAAYAGLPTVNFFETDDQFFLVRELIEAGVSINGGLMCEENLDNLSNLVAELYYDRSKLLEMHRKSRRLIDGKGSDRIISLMEKELVAVKSKGSGMSGGKE